MSGVNLYYDRASISFQFKLKTEIIPYALVTCCILLWHYLYAWTIRDFVTVRTMKWNVTLHRNRNTHKMHAQSFCWQRFCVFFLLFCMCVLGFVRWISQRHFIWRCLFSISCIFPTFFFSSQTLCVRTTQSLTLIIYASLTLFCVSRKSLLWWCLLLVQFNVRNREKSHCGRSDKKSTMNFAFRNR